jgi:hypothetical protein
MLSSKLLDAHGAIKPLGLCLLAPAGQWAQSSVTTEHRVEIQRLRIADLRAIFFHVVSGFSLCRFEENCFSLFMGLVDILWGPQYLPSLG